MATAVAYDGPTSADDVVTWHAAALDGSTLDAATWHAAYVAPVDVGPTSDAVPYSHANSYAAHATLNAITLDVSEEDHLDSMPYWSLGRCHHFYLQRWVCRS
jgi:hypothetical protein